MAFARRATTKDATWARAWTADAVADLTSIAAIVGPNGPRHGDIAFVTANSNYYLWLDNGSWAQITEIAETDGDNIFSSLDAIDIRRSGTARVGLRNTGAGADLKQWYVRVSGVVFQVQTVDDAGGTSFIVLEIDRSGNIVTQGTFTPGGLIDLLAGQIKFPATQNPSADANTLDDYEEGTWTPTVGGSGGSSGQAYSRQLGFYVKVGRLVTVQCDVILSTLGTITTQVTIDGLPFASQNVSNYRPNGKIIWRDFTSTLVDASFLMVENSTSLLCYGITAATNQALVSLVQADLSATSRMLVNFQYLADQ